MQARKARRLWTIIVPAVILMAGVLALAPGASSVESRSGGLIVSSGLLMTSTASPEYSPEPSSQPAVKLFTANQSLRNLIDGCARSYTCERNGLRSGGVNTGDTTAVIYPASDAPFEIAAGTDLPVGFEFAGRGGRPGDAAANPVNLSGAADAGTETIRFCYDGIFISGISSTCKWGRQVRSGDTFYGTDPGRKLCPYHSAGEGGVYGTNPADGPPHISLVTNDAGPVNRSWGPIPGGGDDVSAYEHPNGQLWDARRHRWAHARWTMVTCAGLSIGGLGGEAAFVTHRSVFIYKDEPTPGAVTLSMLSSADERLGSQAAGYPDSWASCSPLSSQPPNPCRPTYELALSLDFAASSKPIGTTWAECGTQSIGRSVSDRVTWPGHATASATASVEVACNLSGTVQGSSNKRVSVFNASDGTLSATGFTDSAGTWSLKVPKSQCPAAGYKILADAPAALQPRWYPNSDNYSSAQCVSSPGPGLSMALPAAAVFTGELRSVADNAPIDNAAIYAFRASDGSYAGTGVTGRNGIPGRYEIRLSAGVSYKLKIIPPTGYSPAWHGVADGVAPGYSSAGSIVSPGSATTRLSPAGYIDGYTKDAATAADLTGVRIHIWRASDGSYAGSATTVAQGRYLISAEQGTAYKVLARTGTAHEDVWSNGAAGYSEATTLAAPATADFSLREAAVIAGHAPAPGTYVSAYTTCGCMTPSNAIAGSDSSYFVKVASTTASGWSYRVRFMPPGLPVTWHSNSASFSGATAVPAPSSEIDG